MKQEIFNSQATPAFQAVLMSSTDKTDWSALEIISRSKEPVTKEGSQWLGHHVVTLQIGDSNTFIFTENYLNGCYAKFKKANPDCEPFTENGKKMGTINPNYQFRVNAGILEMRQSE